MSIHDEVLRAAHRICRERGGWQFAPEEIVRALPHLNESSVRTHIVSRCCIDAPKHHPHKWDYFHRLRRGVYQIAPRYRQERRSRMPPQVAESAANYSRLPLRDSVHAFISRGEGAYTVECLEAAVVTQGDTLDEAVSNLREALALHVEGEDLAALGLHASPKLIVSYESPLEFGAPPKTSLR